LGIAVHNYYDTHNSLPSHSNTLPKVSKEINGGVFVALLPFLEEENTYEETQHTLHSPREFPVQTDTSIVWLRRITAYICPSDNGQQVSANLYAPNNYLVSMGDWADQWEDDPSAPSQPLNSRGAFPAYNGGTKDFAAVTDGLSNTLVFSERLIGRANDVYDAKVGIASGFALNGLNVTPEQILNAAPGGRFSEATYAFTPSADGGGASGNRVNDDGGAFWGIGSRFTRYNLFSTILPPNSPGASHQNPNGRHLIPPSSRHTGGVNVSRFDGSVIFVNDTISCKTSGITPDAFAQKLKNNTGTSLYGVWGALGSINQGEANATP
ncbi:MAG: DUF1559 domain-containing protein, partial [Planctomycetaceae bacterium]|nr:DUF1559 domain-containing protein [Planctomycetaceae bacterium]